HYVFTVHALNVESIPLDQNASGAMVEILASGYSLGSATLTGIYSR
ncbi:kinase inhibitor, partial [Patescibacteria group bacterium]|nr:kinase inhibitor [Patescibacteria group bacterium]